MPNLHFSRAESNIDIRRSKFNQKVRHLTTCNAGFLVPIDAFDVLPGSTWEINVSQFIRETTPIHPVMDDAFVDIYAFYVNNRMVFDQTKEMFGEPKPDPYAPVTEILEPVVRRESIDDEASGNTENPGRISRRSLAAYYGVPIDSRPPYINAKYARGYGLIWNRWFRAEELQNAIDVPKDAIDRLIRFNVNEIPDVQSDPDYYVTCAQDYGYLAPVCKFHDYFTSALRQPQKGDPASIPLNGFAPVYALDGVENVYDSNYNWFNPDRSDAISVVDDSGTSSSGAITSLGGKLAVDVAFSGSEETQVYLNNLVADLGYSETLSKSLGKAYSTITDLRYAFATQRYLEVNSRFGTRFKEYLKGHYGVDASNIELMDPELLGHVRTHVGMNQVVQTSSTDETSPQGNLAAYSLTSDKSFLFRRSFQEYGTIHILMCIRPHHSYQQGMQKKFMKRSKWEIYHPEYANISEQPIKKSEIYCDGNVTLESFENDVFGFQGAWEEYRQFPSRISGQFHSGSGDSFDIWHYGDYYESAPSLSAGWIAETYKNVDRTLTVMADTADQFKCDIALDITHVEPMPVYSIPGLSPYF